ncbi:hypothetical protein B5S28_g1947 [[Candida] boidinii]|nr:hypothetical protein B5S28_g1947 [[Candida] boidinii]OWB72334.1 hypothetical protein B5S31_g2041 [[Candida] boidinii]OWB79061.1 hypothetical protein B5S32_g3271 [[Candida] boidinii]
MSSTAIAPEVLWAQRSSDSDESKNVIYLTVRISDPIKPKINLTSTKLEFEAVSNDKDYKLDLEFFSEIDTKKSKYEITGSHLYFVLFKKELNSEFWPRLTKEKLKYHYIHTDFDKWVDEDEQEEEEEDLNNNLNDLSNAGGDNLDYEKLMQQMQGGGAGGLGALGGALGGAGGLGALGGALGGAGGLGALGGLGGAGGPQFGDFSQFNDKLDEDSSDDEDDEEEAAAPSEEAKEVKETSDEKIEEL